MLPCQERTCKSDYTVGTASMPSTTISAMENERVTAAAEREVLLPSWIKPSSDSEKEQQDRAERVVRDAINAWPAFEDTSLAIYDPRRRRVRRLSPWPPAPAVVTSPEVAHPDGFPRKRACAAPSPDPSGSSWWDILGGFAHRFLAYSFSSCSPDPPPSDGAGHAPALSGPLATLTGTSRIGLPPASPACCDRPAVVVSHPHSNNQRLTAHTAVAPGRVLAGQPQHQRSDGFRGGWAAGLSSRIGPAARDQVGVPAQQGSG